MQESMEYHADFQYALGMIRDFVYWLQYGQSINHNF